MAARLIVILAGCALAAAPASARAQELTLGDIVASVEYARRITDFARQEPAVDAILVRNVDLLAQARVLTVPLADVVGQASHPDLLGRARLRQRSYDFRLPDNLPSVLDTILMVVNGELRDRLESRASASEIDRIRAPFDSLQSLQLRRALEESAEKLRRFELMYGPGSVRLNVVEALLNYGAQWLPGFGVDAQGGPRPFEIVAAYTSAYFTYADERARAVSAAETGVRMYIFREGWGEEGLLKALLRPRHVAAGWAFAGPEDIALQAPWRGNNRTGPFINWGDLKVARITGGESRWLVTRQLQFVPLLF
jgi:hypothetical protein